MRTDLVTTASGKQYSVVDWLNGSNHGPFVEFGRNLFSHLLEISMLIPDCDLSTDTYNDILDTYCVLHFGRTTYSRNVSDLIVVAMNQSNSMTAHDEALEMIIGLGPDLQIKGYGLLDIPWQYTAWDKFQTQIRWRNRPDGQLLWKRKTGLVCLEGFQRRIRLHGLPGGAEKWNDSALTKLWCRIEVEESHLRTYMRTVPLPQAVALLSHLTAPADVDSNRSFTSVRQPVTSMVTSATDDSSDCQLTRFPDRHNTAWSQYQRAKELHPELKTDRDVYDWYVEDMADDEERLPSFDTWAKYVRTIRSALGQQKNKRGVGHETRSVAIAKRL